MQPVQCNYVLKDNRTSCLLTGNTPSNIFSVFFPQNIDKNSSSIHITWCERAGLQLSDYMTQLPLKIGTTRGLYGFQHALQVYHLISFRIKLCKCLKKKLEVNHRGKKLQYESCKTIAAALICRHQYL